jgi:hypothetical protein
VKGKSLFFTPAAKGAIVWSGCRPTGALFWKHGLCLVGLHHWEISWKKVESFHGESRNRLDEQSIIHKKVGVSKCGMGNVPACGRQGIQNSKY